MHVPSTLPLLLWDPWSMNNGKACSTKNTILTVFVLPEAPSIHNHNAYHNTTHCIHIYCSGDTRRFSKQYHPPHSSHSFSPSPPPSPPVSLTNDYPAVVTGWRGVLWLQYPCFSVQLIQLIPKQLITRQLFLELLYNVHQSALEGRKDRDNERWKQGDRREELRVRG